MIFLSLQLNFVENLVQPPSLAPHPSTYGLYPNSIGVVPRHLGVRLHPGQDGNHPAIPLTSKSIKQLYTSDAFITSNDHSKVPLTSQKGTVRSPVASSSAADACCSDHGVCVNKKFDKNVPVAEIPSTLRAILVNSPSTCIGQSPSDSLKVVQSKKVSDVVRQRHRCYVPQTVPGSIISSITASSSVPANAEGQEVVDASSLTTERRHLKFLRTKEVLERGGLMGLTMELASILLRNQELNKEIQELKHETEEFVLSVINSPENVHFRTILLKKSEETRNVTNPLLTTQSRSVEL